MINILFVHQSASLYGSDYALFHLVNGLDKSKFRPIVLLPTQGPLAEKLVSSGVEVHVIPLVTIARGDLTPIGLMKLPFKVIRSFFAMHRVLKEATVDLVHSNTLAVLSGALWAWSKRIKHLWHVHEIIGHPEWTKRIFPKIVRLFSDKVIANSIATREWLIAMDPQISQKSDYIWNGTERQTPTNSTVVKTLRQELGLHEDDILVVLVGRINRLKGQKLLVAAAEILLEKGHKQIYYLMVGSPPPGQEHFKQELLELISVSYAKDYIRVVDFREDIWNVWDACDIAVVPSTEPESFGLTAVEAMAAGKPVVAASHGGLKEIIVDGETGLFFPPGNAAALAGKIAGLAAGSHLRTDMGKCGKMRQEQLFSLHLYVSAFENIYEKTISCRDAG